MCLLFHKWETIGSSLGEATCANAFGEDWQETCVLNLEKCSKCGKERAFLASFSGKAKIDSTLAREMLKNNMLIRSGE